MQVTVGNSNFVSSATGLEEGPVSRVHEIKTPKVSWLWPLHKPAFCVFERPYLLGIYLAGRASSVTSAPSREGVCDGDAVPNRQTPHLYGAYWNQGNMGITTHLSW